MTERKLFMMVGAISVYVTDDEELYTNHFKPEELRCKCPKCKQKVKHNMNVDALAAFEAIRVKLGRGYVPNSAYRCASHPEEAKKPTPGTHSQGIAMDIPVTGGAQRMAVMREAFEAGATGIGVANSFVHVDFRDTEPMAWKY